VIVSRFLFSRKILGAATFEFCNTITQQADIFRRLLHVGFGAIKRNDPWFEILTLLGNSTALQAGALPNSQPSGPKCAADG
jgi:hypothetical protein